MMNAEMINQLSKISNRWTKGDMDRLYIDIGAANELYTSIENREHGQLTLNRRERSIGKIWIDVATGEIYTKGISDAEEVISEIAELIAFLCPVEDVEEETECAKTYTVELCCDRWVAGSGFETNGSVVDSFEENSLDFNVLQLIQSGDYALNCREEGVDYRWSVNIYNENSEKVEVEIDPVWESDIKVN